MMLVAPWHACKSSKGFARGLQCSPNSQQVLVSAVAPNCMITSSVSLAGAWREAQLYFSCGRQSMPSLKSWHRPVVVVDAQPPSDVEIPDVKALVTYALDELHHDIGSIPENLHLQLDSACLRQRGCKYKVGAAGCLMRHSDCRQAARNRGSRAYP